jgi:hypothetical protein
VVQNENIELYYRVLDPQNDAVSLGRLKKAAAALGKRLRLDLIDAG